MSDFEPIRIVGVVEESVTKPRNDGTRGSALYSVPFKLSGRPPAEWADYFPRAWDHPSSWTSAHRPGICEVRGDTIWLNGTTLEEVEKTHKATLLLALDDTNARYAEYAAKVEADQKKRQQEEGEHRRRVSEQAKKIKFD
jgi:hypothetical protein